MCHRNLTVLLTGLVLLLTGCGQKGALYMPASGQDEPVTKVEQEAQTKATADARDGH